MHNLCCLKKLFVLTERKIKTQWNISGRLTCIDFTLGEFRSHLLGKWLSNPLVFLKFNLFWKFCLVTLDTRRRIAFFLNIFHFTTHCKIHRIRRTAYRAVRPSYTLLLLSTSLKFVNEGQQSAPYVNNGFCNGTFF